MPSSNGPRHEETGLRGFANKNGADQPAHPRRLISTFAIRSLESMISKLVKSEISILASVCSCQQAGLHLTLLETRKQVLLRRGPNANDITSI